MTLSQISGHTGEKRTTRGKEVNIADIAERMERRLIGINAFETAEAWPIISLKSNYGLSELRDFTTVTGSGAVSNTIGDGTYSVSTGATASSTASLSSVERGRYSAGTVAISGSGVRIPTLPTGEQVARWGYFDADDGFGFGIDADGMFLFRRKGGVDTVVRREDWDDPLDGTGFSGKSIEPTKLHVYRIPFRWYGSGPAWFEVSTSDEMDLITCHTFSDNDGVIINDPNLPITVETENGATAADMTAEVAGRQFSIMGRYDPNRRVTSEYRLARSVGTTFVPLISFDQKTDYASVSVKLSGLDLVVTGAAIIWQLRVGSTLTGATFGAPSDTPATETALEFDKVATAISGGQAIYTGTAEDGFGGSAASSARELPELDMPDREPVTLCARSVSGTATVTSVLRAREDW